MALNTQGESNGTAALLGVRVRAEQLEPAVSTYEAVIGVKAEPTADGFVLHFGRTRIVLGDGPVPAVAMVDGKPRVGIWAVDLAVADPRGTLERLASLGHQVGYSTGASASGPEVVGYVDHNGVRVLLSGLAARAETASSGDVALDHVALLVGGFDAPTQFWETLTGIHSHRIDVHPVSNGTFGAVRLLLGASMIELVVPIAGTTSMLATRLATLGEGPATLALPAFDLAAKRAQLTDAGIGLVERPPHWFVRPAQAAGVLVQLTPRVNH